MLDWKPVQFSSSAFDDHGPVDEIDDHVCLRSSGELDLFRQNPGRFLEDGRIVEIDGKEVLRFGRRGRRQAQKHIHQKRKLPEQAS